MSAELPPNPSIDQLKLQARELLADFVAGNEEALSRARTHLHHLRSSSGSNSLTLQEAHLIIARDYGFTSWAELKRHVERTDQAAMSFEYLQPDAALPDYERQAELLLKALKSGDEDARMRFKWEHPRYRGKPVADVDPETLDLSDARVVLAHHYSFESWLDLAGFTEAVRDKAEVRRFERAVEAVTSGDLTTLRQMLREYPDLVRARSARRHCAALLHYTAANGVEGWRQKTPVNAVEVTNTLLDAGAEVDALADMYGHKCTTLSLLVSSVHPAEAGLQAELAETLLDYGASLNGPGSNWQSALLTALAFGYADTAEALERRGAPVDALPAAAGLGRLQDAVRFYPDADGPSRHVALALAAQHGRTSVVEMLIDAGEDPDRYNPEGYHAHSTPLHQAALANHGDVVRLLVSRGARLDIRDTIYTATPIGWATHAGHAGIADYLRSQGAKA